MVMMVCIFVSLFKWNLSILELGLKSGKLVVEYGQKIKKGMPSHVIKSFFRT